jgi:hypothetical protein
LAIIIFAAGPGKMTSIFTRAFSPAEVYLGEILLDGEEQGGIIDYTNDSFPPTKATSTPAGVKVYTANFVSKVSDGELRLLNEKLNLLEARISDIVFVLESVVPAPSAASSSSQNGADQLGIIDYTKQPSAQENQVLAQPTPAVSKTGRILVSEIVAGTDAGANYEFVELYNAGANAVDLTGWTLKKKTSSGSEGSLASAKLFSGKIIQSGRYLLLGNASGYMGNSALDIAWSSSNTLAYKKNSVVLYDSDGNKMEEIYWDDIPKGQSLARTGWTGGEFVLTSSPTPQNSQSQ